MSSKTKVIVATIFVTLLIESIIVSLIGYYVWTNYSKLTEAQSGFSEKELFSLKSDFIEEDKKITTKLNKNEESIYQGKFGSIIKRDTQIKNEKMDKDEKLYLFKLDFNKVDETKFLNFLLKEELLDKHLLEVIITKLKTKEERILLLNDLINLLFLTGAKDHNLSQIIINDVKDIDYNNYRELFNKNEYKELSTLLTGIENEFKKSEIQDYLFKNNYIVGDEKFRYILGRLLDGKEENTLESQIRSISKDVGVDYKLVMSAIGVEQLRYLTTSRGQIKSVITQNLPLVSFTKFSFGLGGIKVGTFKTINTELKKYNLDLYNRLFKDIDESTKVNGYYNDQKIINVLQDNKKSILYIAGMMYTIQEKWSRAGHNLDKKPEVTITLYNMGNNKTPRKDAQSGGALLKIFDSKGQYFGDLGGTIYYYLKIYVDKDYGSSKLDKKDSKSNSTSTTKN